MDQNPWIPEHAKPRSNAKQRQYLLLSDVTEVFYGGAAGGGKTYASLIAAAQYVEVPGYAALLLRENYGDLALPRAWIDLSKEWWINTDARWSSTDFRWIFPSGATITFGYLANDDAVYQYDTAAFQFIGIDELTQHTEKRYRFMFGRIRRPMQGPLSQVPLRMRSGSNPGNKGHDWVKKRFIDPKTRERGAVFVPAKLDDNAGNLDTEAYRRDSLSKLDPITRAQREKGDWDAVEGGRFKREWFRWFRRDSDAAEYFWSPDWRFRYMDRPILMAVDPAASKKRTSDYTVVGVFTISPKGDLVWIHCERFQKDIPDIPAEIARLYLRWRPQVVGIEAVAANSAVLQLVQRMTHPVIPCCPLSPRGDDKLVRATAAMVFAEQGRLYLPEDSKAFPLDDVISELTRFTGDDTKDDHDDIVDVLSYAVDLANRFPAKNTGSQAAPSVTGAPNPLDGPAPTQPGKPPPKPGQPTPVKPTAKPKPLSQSKFGTRR